MSTSSEPVGETRVVSRTRQLPDAPAPHLSGTVAGTRLDAEQLARYWWTTSLVRGKRVLDAGCGAGHGSLMLADAGAATVVGFDTAPVAVPAIAGRPVENLRFSVGDVRALPFSDGSFDVVVCFGASEHLVDREQALDELTRVLAEDGILVTSTFTARRDASRGDARHLPALELDRLESEIRARLPHVYGYRQHTWLASVVLCDDDFRGLDPGSGRSEALIGASSGHVPGDELHTLVVGSRAPVAKLDPAIFLSRADELQSWIERVDALQREVDDLRRARGRLAAEWRGLSDRRAAEVGELSGSLAGVHASWSWRVTRPLRFCHRLLTTRRLSRPRAVTSAPKAVRKAVLFVSGGPEVSRRYRCDHQAEQLAVLGAAVDVAVYGEVDLLRAGTRYEVVVLHRVPWAPDVEALVDAAASGGSLTVAFDADDLVFDTGVMPHVAALRDMPPRQVALYEEGLHRYLRTLTEVGTALVSTSALSEHARAHAQDVVVSPNVAGRAMVESAEAALAHRAARPPGIGITIGYFSGTNTHDVDFLEAADALLWILETRDQVKLRIVGPLRLDDRFERFASRIERLPLQAPELLPRIQAEVDIGLAPLEPRNPFTDSKSCVKWIEAGLVGVPIVASPRPDFQRVIEHGRTGLLADTTQEWENALALLVDDPELRARIGRSARDEVLRSHTTLAAAPRFYEQLRGLSPSVDRRPLTINWFMQSPIAQNSGGYRNIFRIAHELDSRGHRQRFCIDPVAHLSRRAHPEIHEFLDEAFGIPANAELVVGHEGAGAADVSIATFWPTAFSVSEHQQSLFRAYFIQDFEPEFYESSRPEYDRAAQTYGLPLRHICLGKHLATRLTELTGLPSSTVDFALDPEFRVTTPPDARGGPPRVLFFARPGLRRRGYELGVEALRLVKAANPEIQVVLFGSRTRELGRVPFDFTNLGVLDAQGVADAMNASHVLLTFSLTNISNVPFEGMACGCAVVDLDLPNVRAMVEPGRNCLLALPEPDAIAQSVITLIEDPNLRCRLAEEGMREGRRRTWTRTADMFEASLFELCFARLSTMAGGAPGL